MVWCNIVCRFHCPCVGYPLTEVICTWCNAVLCWVSVPLCWWACWRGWGCRRFTASAVAPSGLCMVQLLYTFCTICPPGRAMQVSWLCWFHHLTHSVLSAHLEGLCRWAGCVSSHLMRSVLSTHLVSCCRLAAAREYGQLWSAENKGSSDRACDR